MEVIADRRAKALAMRESGVSVNDIRDTLGFKDSRATRSAIRKARADIGQPKPEGRPRKPRDDDGLPVDILTSRDRHVHRMIAQHARRRHERLEGLLRASGLHVSQMTAAQLGSRVWSLEQYDG
ncbi:hypothetical protein [Nocardia sp. R7R-8]|uniref:hypothetical protein n=1 Tax=Nocardia sp. R7R-8 TaxID=3459304 RepID=UPI00403DE055